MDFKMASEDDERQETPPPLPKRTGLTIVHLNNDCLEKIFSYLNLNDLTNVAESNVCLAISASSLFSIKFKEVKYNCHDRTLCDESFLLALEHFGKYITKLDVVFCLVHGRNDLILEAINRNCAATIRELSFGSLNEFKEEAMTLHRPFLKLEKLELRDSEHGIPRFICDLKKWFPVVKSLNIVNVIGFWNEFAIEQLPSLEHFGFFAFPQKITKRDSEKLAQFLQYNQQLRSLGLDDFKDNIMDVFNQHAPHQLENIECLDVVSPFPFPSGRIQFSKLRELKLSFYANDSDIFEDLPQTIEILELRILKLPSSGFDFILKCQRLSKLKLIISKSFEIWQMEKLAKQMQCLTEIHIYLKYCIDESKIPPGFEYFFQYGKQLKTISLQYERSSFDRLGYQAKVKKVKEFLKPMNRTKFSWIMSHQSRDDDNYRTRSLCSYPLMFFNFHKIRT